MEHEKKRRLRVSPSALLLGVGTAAWALWGGGDEDLGMLAALLAAALVHEVGHLLAAGLCGVRITGMRFDLFGARLDLPGLLSYRQELVVALGGPLINLLSVCLILPIWRALGYPCVGVSALPTDIPARFLAYFVPASLGLCAVNLLPVRTLDGGRALSCLLALCFGEAAARYVLSLLSTVVLGALWLLSVYALLRVGQFLALFVFSFSLLVRALRG